MSKDGWVMADKAITNPLGFSLSGRFPDEKEMLWLSAERRSGHFSKPRV
jgi:hypothetical protein